MRDYEIRVSVPEPEHIYLSVFCNFIATVPRRAYDQPQAETRMLIRKELAKLSGNIVYIPHPTGTDVVLYFATGADYTMWLLKFS